MDYWGNRDPSKLSHRKHEAEDRVFSSEPSIPVDGVTAIHLYVDTEAEPEIKAWARKTLLAAKQRKIATHFYTDQAAWHNFDTRKQADVNLLKGQERTTALSSAPLNPRDPVPNTLSYVVMVVVPTTVTVLADLSGRTKKVPRPTP